MAEYIDRQAVIDLVDKGFLVSNANHGSVSRIVRQIPAADVQPVRRGRWELDVLDGTPGYRPVCLVCSECHRISYAGFPYCPNCGARMGEDR